MTRYIIFAVSIMALFACSQPSDTEESSGTPVTATPNKPKANTPELDLSLPENTMADQKTIIINEKPLMPDLFNSAKASSKYQLDGQLLLEEESRLGVEALDGASMKITIKQ